MCPSTLCHYVEYELAQCAPRVEPLLSDMVQLLSEEEEEKESMVSGCIDQYRLLFLASRGLAWSFSFVTSYWIHCILSARVM